MKKLTIVPASVDLKPGEMQAFEAHLPEKPDELAEDVTWSEDRVENGIYTAPRWLLRPRRIALVATQKTGETPTAQGCAEIRIDPVQTWVPIFGLGWVGLFAVLLALLFWFWTRLCPQCGPPGLVVNPPVVTLAKGQAQQFIANGSATWTNSVNASGLYIAPAAIDADQVVTVTATSRSDPQQSGIGIVRLSPAAGFAVLPSRVTVAPGQAVQLKASASGTTQSVATTWLPPAAGTIGNDGTYTAPTTKNTLVVVVLAQAQLPAAPPTPASSLLAGSLISVVPFPPGPCDSPDEGLWRLVMLVALVGALGGVTHAIGSFGTYVGNDDLKRTWLWWYALKPALSALVSILVFFVFRAGLGAPDLGLATGECLKVAGFAGLVGLFAEQATVKLKDIFEAIFTPRRDPREDKTGQGATGQAATANLPEIGTVDPKQIQLGAADTRVQILGKNFADGCVVSAGGKAVVTNRISATELEATIPAEILKKEGSLAVTVFNKPPTGDASKPASIAVKKP